MSVISSAERTTLEAKLGHPFPAIYRELLTTIGHGKREEGGAIYHPLEIEEPYACHFESDGDLFGRYFPIGYHELHQTIWLVDVATGRVASIFHETHPDDYPDEEWLTPKEWRTLQSLP